jgi:hypothetical protein
VYESIEKVGSVIYREGTATIWVRLRR